MINVPVTLPFVYCIIMRAMLLGSLSCLAIACGAVEQRAETPRVTPVSKSPQLHNEPPPPAPTSSDEGPGLQPEQISDVVLERYSSLGGCHTIQFSNGDEVGGAVTLAWKIRPDGSVSDANLVRSSFSNSAFHDCVLGIVRQMKFPPAPGSTEVGQWQISFAARQ